MLSQCTHSVEWVPDSSAVFYQLICFDSDVMLIQSCLTDRLFASLVLIDYCSLNLLDYDSQNQRVSQWDQCSWYVSKKRVSVSHEIFSSFSVIMLISSSSSVSVSSFAFLMSANLEAWCAFNNIAVKVEDKSDNDQLLHISHFMSIKLYSEEYLNVSAALNDNDKTNADVTETDTVTEAETDAEIWTEEQSQLLRFQEHYSLLFAHHSSIVTIEWVIEVSQWDFKGVKQNSEIDLQLALSRTSFSKYKIADKHTQLFFDDTDSLLICIVSDQCQKIVLYNDEFISR